MQQKKLKSMLLENEYLSPNARTLWDLESEFAGVHSIETASNMQMDIYKRTMEAVKKAKDRRDKACDSLDISGYQAQIRDAFLECQGGLPETSAPLNAQVLSVEEYDFFILEKVIYESRPEVYVTANLYRPRKLEQPAPAVLIVMGHADEGKAYLPYQRVAQMMVYAGFVVLAVDPIGQGERFEHYEADIDLQPMRGCSGEHDLMDWKCRLQGLSLSRYFIHDDIRGLDYLASRPEVDAKRIAVTGQSGGGCQTSMLMTAAAERIAAAAPCSCVAEEQAMMECQKEFDNEMIWTGSLAAGLDYVDCISVMAPKPVLLLTNHYDFFPREGAERVFEEAQRIWRTAGSAENLQLAYSVTQHDYAESLAVAATCFFSRHLMGKEADLTDFSFRPLREQELWCTSRGNVLKDFPKTRTLWMELKEEYQKRVTEREAMSWENRKENVSGWLKKTVCAERKDLDPHVRVWAEGICCNYAYRWLIWRAQENYWGAGILLRDMRYGNKPLPTVIALWPEGVRAIDGHSVWIHRQCTQGKQVLVADLAASGSLTPNKVGAPLHRGWSTMYIFNNSMIRLGDSLAAIRSYQAIRAAEVVKDLPQEDPGILSYYGEGEFARYAKIAALLTGVPVETSGLYESWGAVVSEKYHDQTHTEDWGLPGILNYLDMEDIDRLLREQGQLIE